MSKIIKLKQSDIENIVEDIVQKELEKVSDVSETENVSSESDVLIGKDEKTGKIVVFNKNTGAILGQK